MRRRTVLLGLLAGGALVTGSTPVRAEPIQGAGSTFVGPLIRRWSRRYRDWRTDGGEFSSSDWTVDYEPMGSTAGMMSLARPEVDFAATEAPLGPSDLSARGLVQFPIVLGGIVPVINLPGYAAGELRLSGPVLADIFLGDVTRWNDPALRALNPERVLPDMPIVVVHRQDGSGTTQTFTEFLSAESVPFRTRVGSDTLVRWPVGRAAEGGGGVERLTRATVGAIGYLEFGQMRRSGLADAAVRNGTGAYARPSVASMHAAAAAVRFDPAEGFRASMIGAPGQNVYPITAATYVLVPHMARSTARTRRTLHFFRLALSEGAADALQLGYAPLPEELATAVLTNLRERFRQRLTF